MKFGIFCLALALALTASNSSAIKLHFSGSASPLLVPLAAADSNETVSRWLDAEFEAFILSARPPPSSRQICRAGIALASIQNLSAVQVTHEKLNVFELSYEPWPGAPVGSRVLWCKVVGNSIAWGDSSQTRESRIKERLSYKLNASNQSLDVRVLFGTGKSRVVQFPYSTL